MKRYASFFEWHDRQEAELGVAETLLASLAQRGGRRFCKPLSYKPDPPDCVCLGENGGTVAIEVSEVVCPTAAALNAQGKEVNRNWRPGELHEHVARQLLSKDSKSFHGGPYTEVLVCLFTDELLLTADFVARELEASKFRPYTQITVAYLLLSYDSQTKTYPAYELHVQSAA